MVERFSHWLSLVLVHEGGYVNHPSDPGGATNKGVTQAVYDTYRRRQGKPTQSVKHITAAELVAIYRRDYWDKIKGDDLPAGLDYAVFDFAVNSGITRAAQYLQRLVGVKDDGKIGPKTLEAVSMHDRKQLINRLCDKRLSFLRGLGTFSVFGKGWTRRVEDVRAKALAA